MSEKTGDPFRMSGKKIEWACKNNINDEIIKMLTSHKIIAKKYLDMGCGDGNLTTMIAKSIKADEVYGADINNELLKTLPSTIKGIYFDFEKLPNIKLPFDQACFDTITAIEFIEHLSYGDEILKEAYRLLESGGYFLLTTPNLASLLNRFLLLSGHQPNYTSPSKYYLIGGRKVAKKLPVSEYGHKNLYTLRALKHVLELYNFTIIATKGCQANYDPLSFMPVGNFPSLAPNILILSRKRLTQPLPSIL